MTRIRKFVYAAWLAFTTLHFGPGLAYAQEMAHGKFTLRHEVHWQNALVPAGDYSFSLESDGVPGILTLSKLSGSRTGFLFMVQHTEEVKESDLSRLVLQAEPDGSYVRAMELPQFGVRLNFTVPSETTEKQMVRAGTTAAAAAQ